MIRQTLFTLACLTLSATLLTNAEASVVMIDDFQDGTVSLTADSSNPLSTTNTASTSSIGGFRETILTYGTGPLAVRANTTMDMISFSSDTHTSGLFRLVYDADGAGLNADLTNGGINHTLFVDISLADAGSNLSVTLQSIDDSTSASNAFSLTESLAGPGLAEFRLDGFLGVDLTNIDAILVDIEGAANGDYAIDQIYAGVPEPSAMMIWTLFGVGLVAIFRRRQAH